MKGFKSYISAKAVDAAPRTQEDDYGVVQHGYAVVCQDGYESWCPKDTFERANMLLDVDGRISPAIINKFILNTQVAKLGQKTCVVTATLANGFEITESSSCVDPAHYDEELGTANCMKLIINKVWGHLGFWLQQARSGIMPGSVVAQAAEVVEEMGLMTPHERALKDLSHMPDKPRGPRYKSGGVNKAQPMMTQKEGKTKDMEAGLANKPTNQKVDPNQPVVKAFGDVMDD